MRLLWVLVVLVILLLGGLTGYAYFGDMGADPRETRLPVELDLGSSPTPPAAAVTTPAATEPVPAADAAAASAPDQPEQDDLD